MAKNTIVIKCYDNKNEEYDAAEAITPGELVVINSSGTLKAHDVEGGQTAAMFAIEDAYQGKEITEDYAIGDRVICKTFVAGDMAYAIAEGNSASDGITVGDLVTSAGDGTLKTFTKGSVDSVAEDDHAIGRALETVEGGERFIVEII